MIFKSFGSHFDDGVPRIRLVLDGHGLCANARWGILDRYLGIKRLQSCEMTFMLNRRPNSQRRFTCLVSVMGLLTVAIAVHGAQTPLGAVEIIYAEVADDG